jgi:uncharacterized cupin superfamily protein
MTSRSIVVASAGMELEATAISADWILSGKPETQTKEFARSRDRTWHGVVWDCTAGRFTWQYSKDESLVVITGEAFISYEGGEERRIGPGDIVFFPAGTSATWRVPNYIRKVAFVRHTMPRPAGFCVRAWNLILRKLKGGDAGL